MAGDAVWQRRTGNQSPRSRDHKRKCNENRQMRKTKNGSQKDVRK